MSKRPKAAGFNLKSGDETNHLNNNEIEEVPCALCRSSNRTVLFTEQDMRYSHTPRNFFSLVGCEECGLRFLSPRPVESALLKFYPKEYISNRPSDPSATRHQSCVLDIVHWIRPPRRIRKMREKLKLVRRLVGPQSSILAIGPGGGDFLAYLKSQGFDVLGMDINPEVIERIQSEVGVPGVLDAEADERIPTQSKDLVVLWNAFEHIPDPNRLLMRISLWLRPGGGILFSVPNAAALERRLFFPHSSCEDIPRHLFSYSTRTLANLLQEHGFTNVRFKHNTLCSTSELQHLIEERYVGRSKSMIVKAFGVFIGLPMSWSIDRIFALFGRSHTIVASAEYSAMKNRGGVGSGPSSFGPSWKGRRSGPLSAKVL
ncbi:MAG: class I SAM-dependent methyltransferase [Candidatus Eisenbacteria bacterium]|uniref:Class I SAM-dependent methyltransferase n=1 Tax=Eiseniibacteriota bacterium TaxID=2212470 RepID=A0A948W7D5_UNCEI|nr:class I SAM-dependent methyltransferase [Candidatus Eisenbacteria bacterium]MBU1951098.1 class I SAM-dependent methyltransferase [Candidatus Eisenbacteria bacterium]MBU2692484.1 class I SAM-dependent methyltransferase [Candidatus Eisenbacteria bacterium]